MESDRKYGILLKDLNDIIAVINKNVKIQSIILFGSRAKGNFENGSDIDIALKGKEASLNDILEISAEIEELWLPYKIDLVLFEKIKEFELINHINRVGISLFER